MKIQFTEIYDKELWGVDRGSGTGSSLFANRKYIHWLENFLKDNNIKSVIDFGCGDWQFSQHVKWGDIDYLGLDVVESVIETNKKQFPAHKFVCDIDVFPYLKDRDLIIIKDVLMHWPDEQIETFLDRLIKQDIRILLVNSVSTTSTRDSTDPWTNQKAKRKLKIGGFAHLEYDKFPLNKYNPELLFTFRNRQVVLIL